MSDSTILLTNRRVFDDRTAMYDVRLYSGTGDGGALVGTLTREYIPGVRAPQGCIGGCRGNNAWVLEFRRDEGLRLAQRLPGGLPGIYTLCTEGIKKQFDAVKYLREHVEAFGFLCTLFHELDVAEKYAYNKGLKEGARRERIRQKGGIPGPVAPLHEVA